MHRLVRQGDMLAELVGIRVDGHGLDAQLLAGLDHAAGDNHEEEEEEEKDEDSFFSTTQKKKQGRGKKDGYLLLALHLHFNASLIICICSPLRRRRGSPRAKCQ